MYSNNQYEIKAGLVNYIGAIMQSSLLKDDNAIKHETVALLLEEVSTISKNEDDKFNLYACKPILRLTVNIINERINELKFLNECENSLEITKTIQFYNQSIAVLNSLINNTKL